MTTRAITRPRWWLATIALWIGLVSWGIASPVLSAPDENVHLALLYCAAGEARCDQPTEVRSEPCFAFQPGTSARCLDTPIQVSTAGVEKGRYPGLYTAVLSPFVGQSVEATVLRVRLLNATLAVGLLVLAVGATLVDLRAAVVLGFTLCVVPLGMFLLPSLNPTSWAIAGAAALWGPLFSACRSGLNWWRAAAIAGAAAMLLGSRNEGWVIVAVISLVAVVAGSPGPRRWVVPAALLGLSALIAVARDNPALEASMVVGYRGPWEQLLLALATPGDVVGGAAVFPAPLGWLDTPVLAVASLLTVAIAGAMVLQGAGLLDRRKAHVLVAYTAMTAVVVWVGWMTQFPSALQPRFALPILLVGMGVILMPAGGRRLGLTTLQATAVALGVSLANGLSLLALSLRFAVGVSAETTIEPSAPFMGPMDLLRAGGADWSLTPVTPFVVWVVGSLAFGWFTFWVVAEATRPGVGEPTRGGPFALGWRA